MLTLACSPPPVLTLPPSSHLHIWMRASIQARYSAGLRHHYVWTPPTHTPNPLFLHTCTRSSKPTYMGPPPPYPPHLIPPPYPPPFRTCTRASSGRHPAPPRRPTSTWATTPAATKARRRWTLHPVPGCSTWPGAPTARAMAGSSALRLSGATSRRPGSSVTPLGCIEPAF